MSLIMVVDTWSLPASLGERALTAAEIEHCQRHALGAQYGLRACGGAEAQQGEVRGYGGYEYQGVAGGEPGQHGGKAWVVDYREEPAYIIGIPAADAGLGIVHNAVDLFELLRHY